MIYSTVDEDNQETTKIAMFAFGNLEPFEGGEFSTYKERLEAFFVANNNGIVPDGATDAVVQAAERRKVADTISLIGKKTYATFKDLCLPDSPVRKSYKQLCDLLSNYFKPKVSEVAETYRFHQAVQNENESVLEYTYRLKHLAVNCNFGNFLPRALRDQFLEGVRNPTTKTKLLSEDRAFDRAVKIAIADEAAQKEVKLLLTHSATHSANVNFAKGKNFQRNSKDTKRNNTRNMSVNERCCQTKTKECYRCGSQEHLANRCKLIKFPCHYCRKEGHLQKMFEKKRRERKHFCQVDNVDGFNEEDYGTDQSVYMYHVNTNEIS